MVMNKRGMYEIQNAVGLNAEDAATVKDLYDIYTKNQARNRQRRRYYHDEQEFTNLGLAVPSDIADDIRTEVGWCAKAVNMLANRSILDGIEAADEETNAVLANIVDENSLPNSYDMTKRSELIHGATLCVANADKSMRSGVLLCQYDLETASALWDFRHSRVEAGMVVADFDYNESGVLEPSVVIVYTDRNVITLERAENKLWYALYEPHAMGRCPMVAMAYRPTSEKPFGCSRISKTCMAITDEMRRELVRTALHSEIFSAPQKWILGLDQDQVKRSKFDLYMDSILGIGRDENGEIPQVGQFAQASMQPHLDVIESLAARFASETCLPVSAFGVIGNAYQSETALRANNDDIVLEAEAMNLNNGRALKTLAQMALAIHYGKPLNELTDEQMDIRIHWKSPAMPSISAASDAMTKQASVTPWLPETTVYWESLGYSDEQRARILQERDAAMASAQLTQALFGFGAE